MEKGEKDKVFYRYSRKTILDAVGMVEDGFSQKEVQQKFGIASATLSNWLHRYGSEIYHQNKRRSFSKTEKRAVVTAVKSGMSIREVCVAYGLKSTKMVRTWIDQMEQEKTDLCEVVEPMAKKKQTQEPLEDVASLRRELELAKLKIEALNTLIDVAEDQLKIDIRKKSGARRS